MLRRAHAPHGQAVDRRGKVLSRVPPPPPVLAFEPHEHIAPLHVDPYLGEVQLGEVGVDVVERSICG